MAALQTNTEKIGRAGLQGEKEVHKYKRSNQSSKKKQNKS